MQSTSGDPQDMEKVTPVSAEAFDLNQPSITFKLDYMYSLSIILIGPSVFYSKGYDTFSC